MTAKGQLYIDGDCRDTFEKELDEWYGKDKWYLKASDFCECWDIAQFPKVVKVEVIDNDRKVIGKVEITSEFYIEEGDGRYIEITPQSIRKLK